MTVIRSSYPIHAALCRRSRARLAVRDVDGAAERDEPRLLDRLRERGMRRDAVRDRLHRRLGLDRDDSGLDHVGHVRADHHEPEQLAVPRLVDRLDPADRLVLHHRAGFPPPRELADCHVVAVLLARLRLGQPDGCDLRIGVDRAWYGPIVEDRLVAGRVLSGDLAFAERRVSKLPVAGAVADGVDVRHVGPPVVVGRDACALVEFDAGLLEADFRDERAAPDADEHQVGRHALAVAVVDDELRAVVLDPRALLAQLERDAATPELLRKLLRRLRVLLRNQGVEHLDDRHLGAEALENRRELATDDPAAEDDETARHAFLGEQAGRADAAWGIDAFDGRAKGIRAGGDDRSAERDVLAVLDGDRIRVGETPDAFHPIDAVRLEE